MCTDLPGLRLSVSGAGRGRIKTSVIALISGASHACARVRVCVCVCVCVLVVKYAYRKIYHAVVVKSFHTAMQASILEPCHLLSNNSVPINQ